MSVTVENGNEGVKMPVMVTREMELVRAGVDAQGDTFTLGALADVVEKFDGPVVVTMGFDPKKPVGIVDGVALDGEVLNATVALDEKGEKAVDGGMELAIGGRFDIKGEPGSPQVISKFDFTMAALTDKKVK